jgi:hypothetical protein
VTPKMTEWGPVVRDVGVPSVIALILVWYLTGTVSTALAQHNAETMDWLHQLVMISRQICVHTAPNPDATGACFVPFP